jgi:integrase
MALKTGMRKGEILNLKWKDVDLDHETISVTHTKSKKLRQVPIHPELGGILMALPRRSDHVFCNARGRRWSYDEIARKSFERAKNAAGLPDLTFHALRHNFASELVAKGADLRTVQEYMGHSSLTMLQRYAHVSHGIWRSTIQLLGRDIPAERPAEAAPAADTTLALRYGCGDVEESQSARQ